MRHELLLERVANLSERFSWLGIGADIYALSFAELWALYAFLKRLSDG